MRNNKKGFTLVELLAVIVILALIMGIAVVSMSGVLSSSREKAFQETAAGVIHGLRQRLLIDNKSGVAGTYKISAAILESGGKQSPYGKNFQWSDCGGKQYCSVEDSLECKAGADAFVTVTGSGSSAVYTICLSDGEHYLNNASETDLLATDATIYPTPAS